MTWSEIVATLPRKVLGYTAFAASLVLLVAVALLAVQMWRGDAIVCANGAIFAKSCSSSTGDPDSAVREMVARALDERLPGAITEVLSGAIDERLREAIDEHLRLLRVEAPELMSVPIGTVVPYFGKDADIPSGWVLCDGRENPPGSRIVVDANDERGGIQLPDLGSRFIRGAREPLNAGRLRVGGNDDIDLEHTHMWAHYTSGDRWYSYNSEDRRVRVDNWNDGLHTEGSGDYPLLVRSNTELYTERAGGVARNLPSYVELRFIIRIF